MTGHTRLSASSASRFMACPGSVDLLRSAARTSNELADLGTDAHTLAEACLNGGWEPWMKVGDMLTRENGTTFDVTENMANAVQVYTDYVRSLFTPQNIAHFEVDLNNPDIHPDFGGTADAVVYDVKSGFLHVIDYKHGEGLPVEVENNPQLLYYAYGAVKKLKLSAHTIHITVVQPRCEHPDGPVRSFTITRNGLEDWAVLKLLPAMKAAGEASFKHGDHCRFCDGKIMGCPILPAQYEETAGLTPNEVSTMSDAELGRLYDMQKTVGFMRTAINNEVLRRLTAGKEIPGTKLVNSRSDRTWNGDVKDEIVSILGIDALTQPQLLSPAQIDKLPGGKAITARLAYKPDTGVTVAPADDRRSAVRATSASELYGDLGNG